MGMFDTVIVKCPKCAKDVCFQSKAGDCILNNYENDSVPVETAQDVNGDVETCLGCGAMVQIKLEEEISKAVEKNYVYVVMESWYWETSLGQIFSTQEKAEEYVRALEEEDDENFNQADIFEREVK